MAAPTFNAGGAGGLTALNFVAGGMGGALASAQVQVLVGCPADRSIQSSGPGADWTSWRSTGVGTRLVIWRCTLKATTDAFLNTVENYIERYITDGNTYVLSDGKGRSSSWAVLLGAPMTRRIRERVKVAGGVLQRWEIGFEVLRPLTLSGTDL